jgi:DNA-binding NarL/FixJ family response regulator
MIFLYFSKKVDVKTSYNVFLVDDHKLFREGLTFVISQMEGFKVVGEASDGTGFLEMLENTDVDIVLMDISMPGMDGITATIKALEMKPDLKIIALTMFGDEEYYQKMIKTGVSGYILKESGKDELEIALNQVISGKVYFSKAIMKNHLGPES